MKTKKSNPLSASALWLVGHREKRKDSNPYHAKSWRDLSPSNRRAWRAVAAHVKKHVAKK